MCLLQVEGFEILQPQHVVTHPLKTKQSDISGDIWLCRQISSLFKGQVRLFIVNMFIRTQRRHWRCRQDGEGAAERMMLTCLERNT